MQVMFFVKLSTVDLFSVTDVIVIAVLKMMIL